VAVQRGDGVDNRRTDTHDRILAVALHLFAERGYPNTSLREIAEHLGVTKGALYFHFKTKEDIVTGILRGYLDGLNVLLDEAAARPATPGGREQLLQDFAEHLQRWGVEFTMLVRQNFTEVSNLPIAAEMRRCVNRLIEALCPPRPDLLDRTRARTALACLQIAPLDPGAGQPDPERDEQALRQAALTVALEVLFGANRAT
jgi:AcrR family transcriptional regulator